MSGIPITVCIIAKDEEQHIGQCLKHLRKYDFEIIVTDTGSTDHTKEIAEKYADRVVDFAWIDDFAAARNYCASFAKNNWILAIDCDEYVSSIDVSTLRILLQKFPRYTGVLRLTNLVPGSGDEKSYISDDVPRLYNKNYYNFDFPVHEQIRYIDPDKSEDVMDAFLLPIEVIHHGYDLTGEQMRKKQLRNLELLRRAVERNPENGYNYFQVGQSAFVLGDVDAAIKAYETGLRLVDSMEKLYVPELIMSLAKAYAEKGRLPDALALLEQYKTMYDTAKYNYTYANMLMGDDQMLKALMLYIKVTAMKDVETIGDGLAVCYRRITDIYRAMGNDALADIFQEKYQGCIARKKCIVNS